MRVQSRAGETTLRAKITDRVAPGVVYTTFRHPLRQTNVVTTDNSDWATNCPEYKVTAMQVSPSNGPTEWQERYRIMGENSRRVATASGAGRGDVKSASSAARRKMRTALTINRVAHEEAGTLAMELARLISPLTESREIPELGRI